VSKIANNFPC